MCVEYCLYFCKEADLAAIVCVRNTTFYRHVDLTWLDLWQTPNFNPSLSLTYTRYWRIRAGMWKRRWRHLLQFEVGAKSCDNNNWNTKEMKHRQSPSTAAPRPYPGQRRCLVDPRDWPSSRCWCGWPVQRDGPARALGCPWSRLDYLSRDPDSPWSCRVCPWAREREWRDLPVACCCHTSKVFMQRKKNRTRSGSHSILNINEMGL